MIEDDEDININKAKHTMHSKSPAQVVRPKPFNLESRHSKYAFMYQLVQGFSDMYHGMFINAYNVEYDEYGLATKCETRIYLIFMLNNILYNLGQEENVRGKLNPILINCLNQEFREILDNDNLEKIIMKRIDQYVKIAMSGKDWIKKLQDKVIQILEATWLKNYIEEIPPIMIGDINELLPKKIKMILYDASLLDNLHNALQELCQDNTDFTELSKAEIENRVLKCLESLKAM